jgi:hypothetical protein
MLYLASKREKLSWIEHWLRAIEGSQSFLRFLTSHRGLRKMVGQEAFPVAIYLLFEFTQTRLSRKDRADVKKTKPRR